MECRNYSWQWCDLALAEIDNNDKEYDPSYEFECDSEGCCHCDTKEEFEHCEYYESDEEDEETS